MTRHSLLCVTLLAAACGSKSPSQPTPPPVTPTTPPPIVTSGTITATNGGQPLAGVSVEMAPGTVTTDAGGTYSLSFPAASPPLRFAISGTTLVRRTGTLSSAGARTIDLDAFSLDTFDPAYFRAIARNGWEQP